MGLLAISAIQLYDQSLNDPRSTRGRNDPRVVSRGAQLERFPKSGTYLDSNGSNTKGRRNFEGVFGTKTCEGIVRGVCALVGGCHDLP